jgi:endoglucanase
MIASFLAAVLVLVLTAAFAPRRPADAAVAPRAATASTTTTTSTSPLAGPWGRYLTRTDEPYNAYLHASGTNRALLAKIALRARVRWFGQWIPTSQIGPKVAHYISVSQAGDRDKLVQLAVFRLWPDGGEPARMNPLSAATQEDYRAWTRAMARAIGSSRVAVVLEPDLPMALKGWRPDVRLALTRYAAQVYAALPRTTVYIDAGDADWLHVDDAVRMLRSAGVAYARGFSLGATHYWSVGAQIGYARSVVAGLAAAGVSGRHVVIDTADNGRPFTWPQYWAKHPHGDFDNAEPCRTTTETRCDALGHPPTWATADPSLVDAYLWFGRPWLYRQASPFTLSRALQVARTSPY